MVMQCLAVGVVLGLQAFEIPEPTYSLCARFAHGLVYATLITSIGSCISYLLKTRQLLLQRS
jgi:hypothetical protein